MDTKYNFIDFLSRPIFIDSEHSKSVILGRVEIPIIQRDYAQGRKKMSKGDASQECLNETGKRFIDSIFDHLTDSVEMEMDFVYGSVDEIVIKNGKREETINRFQPLDGQQRLTTLFLLHWFVGLRENSSQIIAQRDILGKYYIGSNPIAKEFCDILPSIIPHDNPLEIDIVQYIRSRTEFIKRSDFDDKEVSKVLSYLNQLQESVKQNSLSDASAFLQPSFEGLGEDITKFVYDWYMGVIKIAAEIKDRNNLLSPIMKQLSKFTYETRTSSRQFCEDLCKVKVGDFLFLRRISEEIENSSWFYKSYHKDPTISAMLNMLDAIQSRYNNLTNKEKVFDSLNNLKFYPFPLNGFNLSEDLYIKMNARGKQLTDYENFKADLINWMKSEKNPDRDFYMKVMEGDKLPFYQDFSIKMDNEWTKLFWQVTKNYNPELKDKNGQLVYPTGKLVDPLFMRFFKRYIHISRILDVEEKISAESLANDAIVKYFYGEKGHDDEVLYDSNDFESYYKPCLSNNRLLDIRTILDRLCTSLPDGRTIFSIVIDSMSPAWKNDSGENQTFYDKRIEQTGRMAFCAVMEYLRKNEEFNETHFLEWMRIIWNFIDEPTIRTVEGMIGAMRFIRGIGNKSGDIYEFLTTVKDSEKPKRFEDQFAEEIIKAKLITGDTSGKWDNAIKNAEKYWIFKGKIISLLKEAENTDFDAFQSRKQTTEAILEGNNAKTNCDNLLWIRALLSYCESFETDSISLENGAQDNWRALVGRTLKNQFQAFIDDARKETDVKLWLENRCNSYQPKVGIEWLAPLITWKDKDGNSLLAGYSDSCRISHDKYGYYLHKTVSYSDGAIYLSNNRNDFVEFIISNKSVKMDWDTKSYAGNIENKFFRGTNIVLSREVTIGQYQFAFKYYIYRDCIVAGVLADERKKRIFKDFLAANGINPEQKDLLWICQKRYDKYWEHSYNELLEQIEEEVFNSSNAESIVSRLLPYLEARCINLKKVDTVRGKN